ncbi:MAG: ribonuclease D [Candidatus Puniceispirillales bacterium]
MASHSSVITTTEQLDAFCTSLRSEPYIAVDTEFLRETTYYAKLCLIQISGGGKAMAIDPLAKGIDLASLFDLLKDTAVIKVFHAGRQDLEIFFNLMNSLPTPLYDTQIAAMVCGFGDQVGYDKLVKGMLDINLDKGSRFTDWSQRPLTEKQIRYALDDVIHLDTLFPLMRDKIAGQGRDTWLKEEFGIITDISLYHTDPDEAWRRIKQRSGKPQVLNRLKHLAAWRETEARRRDMPRSRLIKDDTLVAIAENNPQKQAAFARIRGFPGGSGSKLVPPVLDILKKAEATPQEDWPQLPRKPRRQPPQAVLDLLRVLLKHCAENAGVAPRLIANADDLEKIACGEGEDTAAFAGWRHEIFGRLATDLMEGRLALTAKGQHLKLIEE